jgi:predicted glycoside hydrolase/deacetylase ChbG (UPF0249 family)
MKPFILCADDYGLSQPINDAILELTQLEKLQAISCITNSNFFLSSAGLIKPYADKVQIGLHFNLTAFSPLTRLPCGHFGSLKTLLLRSHLHQLNQKALEEEFEAQLDVFIKMIGSPPAFIDGHQYIHQFPIIRNAVLSVYQRKFKNTKPYIRIPANSIISTLRQGLQQPKLLIIAFSGAFVLRRHLKKLGIPYNKSFSGIYDFSTKEPYAKLFSNFLKQIDDGGLIVCHPATPSDYTDHGIHDARVREYVYLKNQV